MRPSSTYPNEASGKLHDWINENSSVVDAATILEVSRAAIYQWFDCASRPGTVLRHKIEKLTKGEVKASEWMTPAERESIRTFDS